MTYAIPGYDAWVFRNPNEQPEAPDATYEVDLPDLLDGYDITGLFDADGELYAVRIGKLTLTDKQARKMLDGAHFERIRQMTPDELRAAQADYFEALREANDAD